MTDTQMLNHVYNMMEDFVGALNDQENFPCLRYGDATIAVAAAAAADTPPTLTRDSCVLKQHRDNEGKTEGFFPDTMCPTCKLAWYANSAQRDMLSLIQVKNMEETIKANDARTYMGMVGDEAFRVVVQKNTLLYRCLKEVIELVPVAIRTQPEIAALYGRALAVVQTEDAGRGTSG